MTHLTITQGSIAETVSTTLIKKLYDVAISIPEPLQGETDNAQISGHISVGTSHKNLVEYLAGTIMYKGTGEQGNNPHGRFLNLLIDVTNAYTVDFEDPVAEQVCIDCFGSNGMVTELDLRTILVLTSLNNGNSVSFSNHPNRNNITKFNEFRFFTNFVGGGTGNTLLNMTNLEEVTFPNSLSNVASMVIACSSLKYIDLHNTLVTTIGNLAQGCTSCEWISLPPSLTSITDYLDSYTSNSVISYVKCYATTPPTISKTKLCSYKTPTIYVPDNSVSLYQADSKWSASGTILPMSNAPQ